jgi:hypothetical protein
LEKVTWLWGLLNSHKQGANKKPKDLGQ